MFKVVLILYFSFCEIFFKAIYKYLNWQNSDLSRGGHFFMKYDNS